MTLTGSATLLFLLAAEALLPRVFSCRWRYFARLAVLLAFSVPLTLPKAPVWALSGGIPAQAVQAGRAALPLASLLLTVWATGAVLFFLWRLCAWLSFSAAVRHAASPAGEREQAVLAACKRELTVKRRVRLYICPGVGAPALVGVLRPVILLPRTGIPADELRCILRHELFHLRRADILCKLAAQAVNAVHWMNPLAWLLAKQIGTLCELSCDEAAVRGLSREERRMYGLSILNEISRAHRPLPQSIPAFAGAKQNLKKRLDIIMKLPEMNKKRTVIATLGALALCAAGVTSAMAFAPAAPGVETATPYSVTITTSEDGTEVTSAVKDGETLLSFIPSEAYQVEQVGENTYRLTYTKENGEPVTVTVSTQK